MLESFTVRKMADQDNFVVLDESHRMEALLRAGRVIELHEIESGKTLYVYRESDQSNRVMEARWWWPVELANFSDFWIVPVVKAATSCAAILALGVVVLFNLEKLGWGIERPSLWLAGMAILAIPFVLQAFKPMFIQRGKRAMIGATLTCFLFFAVTFGGFFTVVEEIKAKERSNIEDRVAEVARNVSALEQQNKELLNVLKAQLRQE